MKTTLYAAYGSNLNTKKMLARCPDAEVVCTAVLKNYRLVFRGMQGNTHCTIEETQGYSVPVLIWRLSRLDEAALDRYEGFPVYYKKEYVSIKVGKSYRRVMLYIMTDGFKLGSPNEHYYEIVKDGYETSGFDTDILHTALAESRRA